MNNSESKRELDYTVGTNWEQLSAILKLEFAQLTDADLKFEAKKEGEMLIRLQVSLYKSRKEVIELIHAFKRRLSET